jgi:hypothetical protein
MKSNSSKQISSFFAFLQIMLLTPPIRGSHNGDVRQIPRNMASRIASRRLKKIQKMTNVTNQEKLLSFLPRLMLLRKYQRAFMIQSLAGIPLVEQVDVCMKNMKSLRTMFRTLYESGNSFALEFISKSNEISVILLQNKGGQIFMKTELYDQFGDKLLDADEYTEVVLKKDNHTVDLMKPGKNVLSVRFFYIPSLCVKSNDGNIPFISESCRIYLSKNALCAS